MPKLWWWNLRRFNIHQQQRGASSARRTGGGYCVSSSLFNMASGELQDIIMSPTRASCAQRRCASIPSDLEEETNLPRTIFRVGERVVAVPSFFARSCCCPSEPELIGPGSWAVVLYVRPLHRKMGGLAAGSSRKQQQAEEEERVLCRAAFRRCDDAPHGRSRSTRGESTHSTVRRRTSTRRSSDAEREREGGTASVSSSEEPSMSIVLAGRLRFLPSLHPTCLDAAAGRLHRVGTARAAAPAAVRSRFLAHGRSGFWSGSVFPSDRARKVLY
jgi:hypothetical protein